MSCDCNCGHVARMRLGMWLVVATAIAVVTFTISAVLIVWTVNR